MPMVSISVPGVVVIKTPGMKSRLTGMRQYIVGNGTAILPYANFARKKRKNVAIITTIKRKIIC